MNEQLSILDALEETLRNSPVGASFSQIVRAQNAVEVLGEQLDVSKWGRQLKAVYDAMKHGRWMTLGEVTFHAKAPEASASARIRDLKKKGTPHEIRRVKEGLPEYPIILLNHKKSFLTFDERGLASCS